MPERTSISSRFRRAVSGVLLLSYTALLLLLAFHHHHHEPTGESRITTLPPPSSAHVHLAAECPLLYYSVTAFQAAPTERSAGDLLQVRPVVVSDPDDNPCCIETGSIRSRAPPSRT